MKIDWMIARDTITIDSAFDQELTAEIAYRGLAVGTTMAIVARQIRHEENYVLALHDHALLVIAESYDGNGGAIVTSGRAGAKGRRARRESIRANRHRVDRADPGPTAHRASRGRLPHR